MIIDINAKVVKFWLLLRQAKFLNILVIVSGYLPKAIWRLNIFYIAKLDVSERQARDTSTVEIHRAGFSDVDRLCEIENKARFFQDRLRKNEICFLARLGGRPAGYSWVCIAESFFDEDNQYFFPLVDGIWLYDVRTVSDYRGKGVYRALIVKVIDLAKAVGRSALYCLLSYTNELSIVVHTKLGFEIVQKIIHIFFLGLNLHFIKNVRCQRHWRINIGMQKLIKHPNLRKTSITTAEA